MPGWLRPEPISEDDWKICGDAEAVTITIDPLLRCPDCDLELRCATFHAASGVPDDDRSSTICVQCSGLRTTWGRLVATSREMYEDPDLLAMLDVYLGSRHLWLSPFMN